MAAMAVAKAARASRVLSRAWDEEETGRPRDSVSLGDQWGRGGFNGVGGRFGVASSFCPSLNSPSRCHPISRK